MNRDVYEQVKAEYGYRPAPPSNGPRVILPVQVEGNIAYVSGHVAFSEGKLMYKGRIGADVSIEDGKRSTALATINCLESLDREVGLDRVAKVIKLTGYLSCAEHVVEHPEIMNAGTKVVCDVFGEAGMHARAALGIHTLPLGASTEVEMIVALKG